VLKIDLLFTLAGMESVEQKKRYNKGEDILKFEPQGLQLLNSDPAFRKSFQQVRCLTFCGKMEGYNVEVEKQFSLNFDGVKTKIGPLEI
jgi:hypothetical protein